jgi:hypothetical protein
MPDLVLIPFPGLGTLVLSRDQFTAALAAGRTLETQAPAVPENIPSHAAEEGLVDAECLAERTGVPKSWWMAQARNRRIPFRKIGRRVRFDPKEVLESTTFRRRAQQVSPIGEFA